MQKKLNDMKIFYENDKQEIKRQHSRMYENFLEETNQVEISLHNHISFQKLVFSV
jgi:hypothetical protein